jgi:anti-anti-sigma factor
MNRTAPTPPSFSVGRTTLGEATVLSPSGSLTFETCQGLRDVLQEVAANPRTAVVVDCRQVRVMDSEALELLTTWHGALRDAGGSLRLCNLNDVCADILMATRLVHVLSVFGDLKEAAQIGGTP